MLRLKIVSPEKVIYDGEAESVKVPGTQGAFEILDHHAPIISSLGDGKVEFTASQGSQSLEVHGGFVEVKKNEVCLCVEV
jgi:F-type H+-transporting ATPase subunit epsilon